MRPERNGMNASRNMRTSARRKARAERGLTPREERFLELVAAWEAAYAAGERPRPPVEAPRVVSLGLPFVGRSPSPPAEE